MNQKRILQKLGKMSEAPKYGSEDYKTWLEQEEFLQFLLYTSVDEIPLYLSSKDTYIYSVLLPQVKLKGSYADDLMRWQCFYVV